MNLKQKLHHIQTKVSGLGKDAAGAGYRFVSGSKVLGAVKPLMNELGLILQPEIISLKNEKIDYLIAPRTDKERPKTEILSTIEVVFTWMDVFSGEEMPCRFFANGQNGFDKGVGSAITYAERYFLLKFFHISTDEDDIDASVTDDKLSEMLDECVTIQHVKEAYDLATKPQQLSFADKFTSTKERISAKNKELKDQKEAAKNKQTTEEEIQSKLRD